jgi:hypothetical protein
MLKEEHLLAVAYDLLERWRIAIAVVLLDIAEIQLEFISEGIADIDLPDSLNSHCVRDKLDGIDIF